MHFLNWLVTELKKKIWKKRPEFNYFPDKSHNVQLWSHGPVRAALLTSGPASGKEGSGKLHEEKGPFACRGGIALATASFFSQNVSGLFPRRKTHSLSGTQFSSFFSRPKGQMNIQSKLGGDKCIVMPKEESGWGEQLAVLISCFLPKSGLRDLQAFSSVRPEIFQFPNAEQLRQPDVHSSLTNCCCSTSAPLAAYEQS